MKTPPKELLESDIGLHKTNNIILAYRGSVAHGMHINPSDPNSVDDIDLMAICVPPLSYYIGLDEYGSRGTKEIMRGEWDVVIYEMRKAISLLIKGNPNILTLLWLEDDMYLNVQRAGKALIDNRDLFSTNRVYDSFIGYALGQLHRMEHGAHKGFMGEKRKKLVDKYGFDCKNGAHLIRLLRMAIEFFEDGEFIVDRTDIDAQELLAIKTGEWSLEKVKSHAEQLFSRAEIARKNSKHPDDVDWGRANRLCENIVGHFHHIR